MGLGLGNCCCFAITPPPPDPPGDCDYDDFCPDGTYGSKVLDPATTFSVFFNVTSSDDICWTDCDDCPTSPMELVLSPGTGGIAWTNGYGECWTTSPFDDSSFWASCNDSCFLVDFTGVAYIQRSCTSVDDPDFCPVPPYPPAGAVSLADIAVSAYLRIWKDGCYRLLVSRFTSVSASATTCLSGWYQTFSGTLTCCGDTTLGAAVDSQTCTGGHTGSLPCAPTCDFSIKDNKIVMNCP